MNAKKIFFAMLGLLLLLFMVNVSIIIYGGKILRKQSTQLAELKLEGKLIEEQQVSAVNIKKDIVKYSDLEAVSKSIVPQDKDQAKTIREINKIADASGIKLRSIAFAASSLGSAPAPTASSSSENDKPATSGATAPSQLKAAEGISGVYTLEITISSADGEAIPYSKFIEFLGKLETNRRTAHVNKLTVTPLGNGVSFNITLNAYVKP